MTANVADVHGQLGGEHPAGPDGRGGQPAQDALLPVAGQHRRQRVEREHGDDERDQDRDIGVQDGQPGHAGADRLPEAGMLPKMISSRIGNPTPQITPTRSRTNSFASVSVSWRSARGVRRRRGGQRRRCARHGSFLLVVVRRARSARRKRPPGWPAPPAAERRRSRCAASTDVTASATSPVPVTTTGSPRLGHAGDLGQAGQQAVVHRPPTAGTDPLLGVDAAGQRGRGVQRDDLARVDQRDPVAQPFGLLHEVGDRAGS